MQKMNMQPIEHIKKSDRRMSYLIGKIGVLDIKEMTDPYRFLVGEIIGQMINENVKKIMTGRLISLCDGEITPDSIKSLSVEDLRHTGISTAKCNYIQNLTNSVSEKEIDLTSLSNLSDEDVYGKLVSIKGIGAWTAKMFLLFYLQRPNILPIEDVAFIQGFNWLYGKKRTDKDFIRRKAKKWVPFCSLASRYIYECVNRGLIKQDIKDFLNAKQ